MLALLLVGCGGSVLRHGGDESWTEQGEEGSDEAEIEARIMVWVEVNPLSPRMLLSILDGMTNGHLCVDPCVTGERVRGGVRRVLEQRWPAPSHQLRLERIGPSAHARACVS